MEKIRAYTGKDNYIFISYAHKDRKIIFPIIEELQKKIAYYNIKRRILLKNLKYNEKDEEYYKIILN